MPRRNRSNHDGKPSHTGKARRTTGKGRNSYGRKVADLGVVSNLAPVDDEDTAA